MALAGRRFVQHPQEMRFPHGATFASGQVSTTGFLTQAQVDNAVAAHLRADEVVSLKGLRVTLERQVGVCLGTRKAEITHMAMKAVENLAVGFSVKRLPCPFLARLRDPYQGVWEPGCRTIPAGAAVHATRGRLLFTELCDYTGGDFGRNESNYTLEQQDGPIGKICCGHIQKDSKVCDKKAFAKLRAWELRLGRAAATMNDPSLLLSGNSLVMQERYVSLEVASGRLVVMIAILGTLLQDESSGSTGKRVFHGVVWDPGGYMRLWARIVTSQLLLAQALHLLLRLHDDMELLVEMLTVKTITLDVESVLRSLSNMVFLEDMLTVTTITLDSILQVVIADAPDTLVAATLHEVEGRFHTAWG